MATDSMSVFKGGLAAIIGILVTLGLFFSVGIPAEKSMSIFEDGNMFDVGVEWESYDGASRMMSIMYVSFTAPALIGLGTMFLVILRRQRRDIEEVVVPGPGV